MEMRKARQISAVSDNEFSALIAVVRPILTGILNSLKADVVEQWGRDNVPLKMLARIRRAGDGDYGICFEYAVHDALNRGDGPVVERVAEALKLCKIQIASVPTSVLFGAEKHGGLQLIANARATLTDNSRLLKDGSGAPIKLGKYLETAQLAFNQVSARESLPTSIKGLWKADLFLGCTASDRWVAASVKINAAQLESARGIRIGIVPASSRHGDLVRFERGLIVCPIPHDYSFMQKFYEAWRIVSAFLHADARVPAPAALPHPVECEVARVLAERREFSVRDVIDALGSFAQPELILTEETAIVTTNFDRPRFWQRLFRTGRPTPPNPLPTLYETSVLAPVPLILN